MRHYRDYKKQSNIFLWAVLLLLACVPAYFSFAQSAEELQSKIAEKNNDISRLEQEIAGYQKELDGIAKQKSSLNGSIKSLDLTRKKLVTDIRVTEAKIAKTNLKIQSLSKDINSKQSSISNHSEAIAIDIRRTDEYENATLVEELLSSEDFTSVWNDIDNRITLRERMIRAIKNLRQAKVELEDDRDETIDAKNELVELKIELADQKKIVEQNTKEKQKLLAQTKNSEANYQKILDQKLALKEAFERELWSYESQLTYILDPSKIPTGAVFSWPLDSVYITQLFGRTASSGRLYASGTHSGVDFRAAVGTPVKAMASGTVAGVGDTDQQCPGASFGKFVFIKYDNGLASAFGHLSLTRVNVGDRVARGAIVAYSGNTGHSTGPHLHVTVYAPNAAEVKNVPSKSCPGRVLTQPIAATNAYLDPMRFFPQYKK